jgi:hypothetical protein
VPAPAAARKPRVVFVTRKTGLMLLLERHGTAGQARFYLESRGGSGAAPPGGSFDDFERAHERFVSALDRVLSELPPDQRVTRVDRDELDRFLFAPDDLVLVLGQDGLVPNVAKYLDGQRVIGVNPDPSRWDGVLCRNPPELAARAVAWAAGGGGNFALEQRTMALAEREDGQRLLALNEVFVGHRTHQSARYRLTLGSSVERQSSSGIICATGTGCTGWGRSIAQQRHVDKGLPTPAKAALAYFVREPFPSVSTGTSLDFGLLEAQQALVVDSEMGEGGTVFADGIESDRLEFLDGHRLTIRVADRALALVVPARKRATK